MRAVWFSAIVSALLLAGTSLYLAPLSPTILELQLAGTPRAFGAIVHTWPVEHLARFRNHLPVDCVLILAYGSFGYLLATRTSLFVAFRSPLRQATTWILPLAAAFDAIENALHWWLTEAPRFGVPLAYAVSALAAGIKWLLVLAFMLTVVYALASRTEA